MTVLRQNTTVSICISNPASKCGYLLKIFYRKAKLFNVVYTGLPNSTFRSYGRERPVPQIRFMKMTEVLTQYKM